MANPSQPARTQRPSWFLSSESIAWPVGAKGPAVRPDELLRARFGRSLAPARPIRYDFTLLSRRERAALRADARADLDYFREASRNERLKSLN